MCELPHVPLRPAIPPSLYALVAAMLTARAVMAAGGVVEALAELPAALRSDARSLLVAGLLVAVALVVRKRFFSGLPVDVSTSRTISRETALALPHMPRVSRASATDHRFPRAADLVPLGALVALSVGVGAITSLAELAAGDSLVAAMGSGDVRAWELTVLSDASQTRGGAWRCRVRAAGEGLPTGDLWLMVLSTPPEV